MGQMADEDDMEMMLLSQRVTSSPNSSIQDMNPFEHPTIHLFKTNRESYRAQYDILPEDYNPIKSRLPNPIAGPSGILPDLDGETTSEMLVRISISGLIRDNPT